jgi:hypothetical protein
MKTSRNLGSWLCAYLLAVVIFVTAATFAFFHVINAENIKNTLNEEGVYSEVVPAVLSTAASNNQALIEQDIPLDEPWVRGVADKAFPASDLEQKAGQAIDGTFGWLEGETTEPEFTIDFTANKQTLSQEVANHVETRAAGLPTCNLGQTTSSVDAFRATCLPYGVTPQQVASQTAELINNDQGLLANPVVSPDNLSTDSSNLTKAESSPSEGLGSLQSFYQNRTLWLWLLSLSVLLLSAGVVLLANDRRVSLGRLARVYLTASIGLLIFGLLSLWSFESITRAIPQDAVTGDLAAPVILSLAQQTRAVYLVCAGILLVVALGLFAVRRYKSN